MYTCTLILYKHMYMYSLYMCMCSLAGLHLTEEVVGWCGSDGGKGAKD